ncbi:hypothetical protein V8F06_001903 [Rhypophila decipiens]
MHITLKSLVTFAAMAVFSATASPAPSPQPEPSNGDVAVVAEALAVEESLLKIKARQDPNIGCVRMCADHFFQGDCFTFCTHNNQCANMGGGFNDWVSSLEVTSNHVSWTCTYYEHASCTGASFTSQYDDTLHDSGGWWADRISSIRCWRKCSPDPFCPN